MDAWHSLAAASVAAGRARAHLQGKPVQRYPRVGGRSGMEIHRARMELSLIAQEAPTAQRIRMMKHLMAAGLAGPSRAGWEDARHAINCRDLIVQREDLLAARRRLAWARLTNTQRGDKHPTRTSRWAVSLTPTALCRSAAGA